MNIEQGISNIELFSFRHGTISTVLPSMFVVRCWMFTLALLAIGSYLTTAQSLQKIYSGLDNATSISVTQNSIYIVEQGKNRLLKLDHNGKLLESIGGKGTGDYQFSKPVDVDATNGLKIFVTDYNNRRIQVFDRRGQYLSSISQNRNFGSSRLYESTQIFVSNMGEVYFVDEGARQIYRFDLDYNLLDEFRYSAEIKTVDEFVVTSLEILILDISSKTIHRLALNGSYHGFYPADGVRAIFADDTGLWTASENEVRYEPRSGEPFSIEFQGKIQSTDISIHRENLFLLTSGELFKLSVPER